MKYIFLTQKFYDDHAACTEIETKVDRPYVKVLIELDGHIFAIPMRSHISHPHVLWTDKEHGCGLDFSKTVVLTTADYIDTSRKPYLRPNEFDALRGKEYIVKQRLKKYIADYKKAKSRLDIPRNRQLCQFSTLQYFEEYIFKPASTSSH